MLSFCYVAVGQDKVGGLLHVCDCALLIQHQNDLVWLMMQLCLYCPHRVALQFKKYVSIIYMTSLHNLFCYFFKSPKFVLRSFPIATRNILCFLPVILFFVWKYYQNMFNKLFISFLDLKNICFDTNIIELGTFLAILETKMYFMAAILNSQLFGGKKRRDFVVSGSFEFSIVQSPMLQIVMLLSGCAHTRHFLLHIRPTNIFFKSKWDNGAYILKCNPSNSNKAR